MKRKKKWLDREGWDLTNRLTHWWIPNLIVYCEVIETQEAGLSWRGCVLRDRILSFVLFLSSFFACRPLGGKLLYSAAYFLPWCRPVSLQLQMQQVESTMGETSETMSQRKSLLHNIDALWYFPTDDCRHLLLGKEPMSLDICIPKFVAWHAPATHGH